MNKSLLILFVLIFAVSCSDPEKIKKEIDDIYNFSKSIPASNVCENYRSYSKLITVEEKYKTNYYLKTAKEKQKKYKSKCDEFNKIEKERLIFNTNFSLGNNVFFRCDGALEAVQSWMSYSKEVYILHGYQNDDGRYKWSSRSLGWNPGRSKTMFIHLSKADESEDYNKYQYLIMDKDLGLIKVGYNKDKFSRYGDVYVRDKTYGFGGFDINRENFILGASGTKSKEVDSKIGVFTTTTKWSSSTPCSIDSSADKNWFNNIYKEHLELRKKHDAKMKLKAKIREEERKKRKEEQKKKNKI